MTKRELKKLENILQKDNEKKDENKQLIDDMKRTAEKLIHKNKKK